MSKELETSINNSEGLICYTQPRGYGKTYYELEKLRQENQQLHNKIDKLEDEINWYKQECDELKIMCGLYE